MWTTLRADIDRHRSLSTLRGLRRTFQLALTQGIWAVCAYRFNQWVVQVHIPLLRQILGLVGELWHKAVEVCAGISLPAGVEAEPGLYIGHFGGIILNPGSVLGKDCNISQGVTLGVSGVGDERGAPRLGDRVYVGAGAKLVGKITVGDDVIIGANAVVTESIPSGSVIAGSPARVIRSVKPGEIAAYLYGTPMPNTAPLPDSTDLVEAPGS